MPGTNTDNSICASAEDRLIAAHDGDVALLYIYITRTGSADLERAAHDLCRTLGEMSAAEEKLRRMGLISAGSGPVQSAVTEAAPSEAAPEERLPEYRAEDIARRSKEDGSFSVILSEAAKVIGHALNGNDMRVLFGIYDYLALPAEVILELLNFCAEQYTEKYGTGRRPTARAIEKEAYFWVNREILTLEQAEEYIRFSRERRGDMGRVKAVLGIRGRELGATESKYVSSWLDMGFDDEAIAIAYDRTLTGTGALKWPYMNTILKNWHDNGLHSAAEIEARDGRRKKNPPHTQGGEKAIDMDELRDIINKI